VGPAVLQRAGPEIWQDHVPGVDILDLLDFFGGRFKIGQRAWENPPGLWNYEYAVYNMNSAVGAGAFELLLPSGITLSQIEFHDVDYHSGDGLDDQNVNGADWLPQILPTPRGDVLRWQTDLAAPNGNALRWGAMSNFRFQSDLPPQPIPGGLEQFGAPGLIPIEVIGPGGGIVDCEADFDGNGEIGFGDLVDVLSAWGLCVKGEPCPEDLSGDGDVGFADLVELLSQWGDCPG